MKSKKIVLLPRYTQSQSQAFLLKKPAYIFHHFIKCGGSSVVNSLKNWFNIVYDHLVDPKEINEYIMKKYDINNLNSETCIVGHFAYDGTYLFQRYPELISKNNVLKTFTFIREPLNFNISFYYYTKSQGRLKDITLLEFINSNKDLLAYYFPCDEYDYKNVIDRYFFIGITEQMQNSFDKLALLFGKRHVTVPVSNKSEKDSQISLLTEDFVKKFREKNKLDYLIYDYCLEKFNKI